MTPISRSSEYAIRAMTYLAQRQGTGYCLTRAMAETLGIPAPFLGKVLQPLVVRGVLDSQRGRNGGFRLARRPEEITLFDVVDAHEHVGRPRVCFLGQADCTDERACPMHEFWKQAHERFLRRLHGTSLADMIEFCRTEPQSGYPAPAPA